MMTNTTQYFRFEEDFVEDGVRCIPMIVRFKLDACGIKLQLAHWSRFTPVEREQLAGRPCSLPGEIDAYRHYLTRLIARRTGGQAKTIAIEEDPAWADNSRLSPDLVLQLQRYGVTVTIDQWRRLQSLQRFALLKLCRPGHENRNFPIALKEFGLCENII